MMLLRERVSRFLLLLAAILGVSATGFGQSPSDENAGQPTATKVARVFILAGQSNMQGHAVVDLDDPRDYNGGLGTLVERMKNSPIKYRMQHLRGPDGNWAVRDDAFVWHQADADHLKTGGLSIDFSSYSGDPHHFGPELQIGHVLGDAFEEPVLLIKTAWGGKSLAVDFRPPSSGGEVGPFYVEMFRQIAEAMEGAPDKIPALRGYQLQISGFIWQQGWNDMVDADATTQYAANLENLIADVRRQIGIERLPFVYGELGNLGVDSGEGIARFRAAQRAVAGRKLDTVAYVETAAFARPKEVSPNVGHGHHWYGNAESYFLVGDALGKAMVQLTQPAGSRRRVLILGDSISIGYTPIVAELLAPAADVMRPTLATGNPENCQGTDYGLSRIDAWLAMDGGNWDVIHVNFGLHDLKHVDPETGKNSNDPQHPFQSGPEDYERQLEAIIRKLLATDAKLILATTTPVPGGDLNPIREPEVVVQYNEIARKVAARCQTDQRAIAIDDLYQFAEPKLNQIQRPANVHFTNEGSQALGVEVAKSIRAALAR